MSDMKIRTLVLGVFQTNCYIVSNEKTKEAIVIDPAEQAVEIKQLLQANDLVCKGILLTHGHFDHIMAVKDLTSMLRVPVYSHEAEGELLKDSKLNASTMLRMDYTIEPDVNLKDQEILNLAGFQIQVIHTPGHTVGSVCYSFTGYGVLFSGDTLFRESVGRTDLPTGDGRKIIESIQEKLMILEDPIKVYPGHGNSTTIGYERENNIYLSHDQAYFDF